MDTVRSARACRERSAGQGSCSKGRIARVELRGKDVSILHAVSDSSMACFEGPVESQYNEKAPLVARLSKLINQSTQISAVHQVDKVTCQRVVLLV